MAKQSIHRANIKVNLMEENAIQISDGINIIVDVSLKTVMY